MTLIWLVGRATGTVEFLRLYLIKMQQSQNPDLTEIRAFIALADSGSFTSAAQTIGRDAAIVSRRLKSLEARLGIRLVDRNTRRVALTAAGESYLAEVRPLLEALERADEHASELATGEPRGHLRVALPGSFSRTWLRPLIVEFLAAHPRVTISCETDNRFVDLIGERFDVAIRLGNLADSRLIARKVAVRRRLLCAAPRFLSDKTPILVPSDLANVACLCSTAHSDPYRWSFTAPDGEIVSVPVSGPLATDDAGLLVDAALAGLGVLRTTDWYVAAELERGSLRIVLPDWPAFDEGGVYVLTPASSGTTTASRAFSDWFASRLATPPWIAQGAPA
ncbi:LysR family transcriptional regulator [Sphingomonas beigongshangi]|uniref:LysR family transcriptional regulator n=1 Tax=Sphingomonas beigongshangi TaxID=2782540 RepID=UPI001AEE3243|nr:LysR family transcriptional regulator [Sphingomonas beigongshangi]